MVRDNEPCRYHACTVHPRRRPVFTKEHFSKEEVFAICDRIIEGDTYREIAEVFRVNKNTISKLRRGLTYRQYVDEWRIALLATVLSGCGPVAEPQSPGHPNEPFIFC